MANSRCYKNKSVNPVHQGMFVCSGRRMAAYSYTQSMQIKILMRPPHMVPENCFELFALHACYATVLEPACQGLQGHICL